MNKLSQELTQRIEEASKDMLWVKKISAAATWDEYEKLLGEKGIEAPAEMKEAFIAGREGKAGKLGDDELEKVAGGSIQFDCPREPSAWLCGMTNCPHCHWGPMVVLFGDKKVNYCDLGYWREEF